MDQAKLVYKIVSQIRKRNECCHKHTVVKCDKLLLHKHIDFLVRYKIYESALGNEEHEKKKVGVTDLLIFLTLSLLQGLIKGFCKQCRSR